MLHPPAPTVSTDSLAAIFKVHKESLVPALGRGNLSYVLPNKSVASFSSPEIKT